MYIKDVQVTVGGVVFEAALYDGWIELTGSLYDEVSLSRFLDSQRLVDQNFELYLEKCQ